MFFLHDSVKTDRFKNDKKLNLLQNNVITPAQFINLIEQKDDYLMIGPAVVAKSNVKDFLLEWKMKQLHIDAVKENRYPKLSQDQLMEKIDDIANVFPEIAMICNEFKEQLKVAVCPRCVKKRYSGLIVQKTNPLKNDGRDTSKVNEFLNLIEMKFSIAENSESDEELLSSYDVEWLKPDSLTGLGSDLIANLDNCFECTIKHIGRAKILYEEFLTGYPDHKNISFDELDKGIKDIEQAYVIYLDSMSQLDMASCELIGDIISLPKKWATDMIDLANEIRLERINSQANISKIPDFDGLRLKVKKLEIKTHQLLDENSIEDDETST